MYFTASQTGNISAYVTLVHTLMAYSHLEIVTSDIIMSIRHLKVHPVRIAWLLTSYKRTLGNAGSTCGLQYAPCWLFDVATTRCNAWPQIALPPFTAGSRPNVWVVMAGLLKLAALQRGMSANVGAWCWWEGVEGQCVLHIALNKDLWKCFGVHLSENTHRPQMLSSSKC